jgi:RNA methyltransferase, TrmH family
MSRIKKVESLTNPLVQQVKKIADGRSDKFWILEGKKLVLEGLKSGIPLQELLITTDIMERKKDAEISEILRKASGHYTEVSSEVMKKISTLETPPGILGVAERLPVPEKLQIKKFAGFIFGIRDPGNLGTIIRSAEAAGCDFVACSSDCVEPYSPKVVRGSMGSIFRVPVFKIVNEREFLEKFRREGVRLYGLQSRGGTNLFDLKPAFPAVVLIGSETRGIQPGMPFDETVSIPMQGQIDSLNAAMAATVCFYHFGKFRQETHED